MKKVSLLAALALGGLLACSTLATAQDTTTNSVPKKGEKGEKGKHGGLFSPEARLDRLSTDLTLTDAQKPKVKAVFEDSQKAMQGVPREDMRAKMKSIREEENKKLKEILTPDQWDKYQKIVADARKKGVEKKKKSTE
jgi:Spy/CpxP family protein refolding chaperone